MTMRHTEWRRRTDGDDGGEDRPQTLMIARLTTEGFAFDATNISYTGHPGSFVLWVAD